MKYNKWTVALAALGVVSFASAAKAEEKASPVMTALSSTTISGYVDTSAQWNIGTGNQPTCRLTNSAARARPTGSTWTSSNSGSTSRWMNRIGPPGIGPTFGLGRMPIHSEPHRPALKTSDFGIRQAYVALRAPVGKGLDFKMGVFDSIIGYESIEAGNNPNFTRSYGHSIEPQTRHGPVGQLPLLRLFQRFGWRSGYLGLDH